jgi:hypothetical protein
LPNPKVSQRTSHTRHLGKSISRYFIDLDVISCMKEFKDYMSGVSLDGLDALERWNKPER